MSFKDIFRGTQVTDTKFIGYKDKDFFDADEIKPPQVNLQLLARDMLHIRGVIDEIQTHLYIIAVPFYMAIVILAIGSLAGIIYAVVTIVK